MIGRPFFLEAQGQRLFAMHHLPDPSVEVRGHVLCISGFNEENNRCRSMLTLQARSFAQLGFGTLVLDLHGTGDSDGEYRDARWSIWLKNIEAAVGWLEGQPGGCNGLLGVRLGAILAAETHSRLQSAGTALILWQPVVDGKLHMTQFLRVRMAAQLDRPGAAKETTASMRQQLAAGETVEVGGYELHPELVSAIDAARLISHRPASAPLLWLEQASSEPPSVSAPSQAALQAWQAAGVSVDVATYAGPAFWQVYERVVTPSIIEKTTSWFRDKVASQ